MLQTATVWQSSRIRSLSASLIIYAWSSRSVIRLTLTRKRNRSQVRQYLTRPTLMTGTTTHFAQTRKEIPSQVSLKFRRTASSCSEVQTAWPALRQLRKNSANSSLAVCPHLTKLLESRSSITRITCRPRPNLAIQN